MSARRNALPNGKGQPKLARAERDYARSLKMIGHHIGELVVGFPLDDPGFASDVTKLLFEYAHLLKPWALQTAKHMVNEVNARDLDSWRALGQAISAQLHHDIKRTAVGDFIRTHLDNQVALITSIPVYAAERVHKLTLEGLEDSTRANVIAKEIAASGEVAESRATLIARTEVSRTASILTQARAQQAGSDAYVWEISDNDARPSHKAMQGHVVRWDNPPTLDGMVGHAGMFPNCRCWPRVIL